MNSFLFDPLVTTLFTFIQISQRGSKEILSLRSNQWVLLSSQVSWDSKGRRTMMTLTFFDYCVQSQTCYFLCCNALWIKPKFKIAKLFWLMDAFGDICIMCYFVLAASMKKTMWPVLNRVYYWWFFSKLFLITMQN